MADKFTPEERSRIMARVKGKNTNPERVVRSLLHRLGFRFRIHRKDLPGKPDVVLPKYRKVILVHGCFWHGHQGCPRAARPTTNTEFWNRKIDGNVARDVRAQEALKALGWEPLIVWQCQTRDIEKLGQIIKDFMKTSSEGSF